MYKPLFNTILVEISDEDAKWGTGIDDSMLGRSYREGTVVAVAGVFATHDYPFFTPVDEVDALKGKRIMWNEGVEAGTIFEEDGKLYAFIYWWDIRGVKNGK